MYFLPKNRLKSVFKTLTVVLIIYSVFTGLSGADFDIDTVLSASESEGQELQEIPVSLVIEQTEEIIKNEINDIMKEAYPDFDCRAELCASDSEGIIINKIEVYGIYNDDEKNEIIKRINEYVKSKINIDFIG